MEKVLKQPWAITDAMFDTILRTLGTHLIGRSSDTIITMDEKPSEDYPEPFKEQNTMIIPVHGIIGKHLSSMERMCTDACDLDDVNDAIDAALADSVDSVVFDFRTWGGTVTGVPETSDRIAELTDTKQTIAFCDANMCSAGYWMGSQCSLVAVTKTAVIGSIGVRLAFMDQSRWMAAMGLEMHSFQAGEYKTMGAFWRPPTDKENALFKASVDKSYVSFTEAVRARRQCSDDVMQGQCFEGDEGLRNGLADVLIGDLDDAIALARA